MHAHANGTCSWYTAEINPERYAFERFAKRIARDAGLTGVIPVDVEDEEDGVLAKKKQASDVDSGEEWEPSDWGR